MHGLFCVECSELPAVDAPIQNAAYQGVARFDDFFLIEVGDFGEVLCFAHDQLGDATHARFTNSLPPGHQGIAEHIGAGALKGIEFLVPPWKLVRNVFTHHRFKQIFFALEVQKQGAFGDACPSRDFLHACGRKTFFDKQVQRRIKQFTRTRLFAALSFGRLFGQSLIEGFGHNIVNDWLVSNVSDECFSESHGGA